MKYFIVCIFLAQYFYANILEFSDNKLPKDTLGYTYYKVKNSEYKLADKLFLGIQKEPFYTKFQIKNTSSQTKQVLLYHARAGTNYIDVDIYKNNTLFKTYKLGDMRDQSQREILNRYSLFTLDLEPNSLYTIKSKIENYGVYNIGWQLESPIHFFQKEQTITMLFGLLGGFLIFYILFNIALYVISKSSEYIFLAAIVLSVFVYIFSVYGYFYSFDFGIPLHLIGMFSWIAPLFSTIFLLLFPYYFFNAKQDYPKISKLLLGLIALFSLIVIVTLYMLYFDTTLFRYYGIISLIYMSTPFVVFGISLYFFLKKEEFGIYYFLGQLILTFFNLLHTSEILGMSVITSYSALFIPFAITVDALFLLYIVYLKSKKLFVEQQKEKEFLTEQLRYVSIGQAIGGIVHQWKTPITYIGNIVANLQTTLEFNKTKIEEELKKQLPELENNIEFMSHTSQELLNQYQQDSKNDSFSPLRTLDEYILKILSSKITLSNAKIDKDIDENLNIEMDENIFINIMMILIDNSLDAKSNTPHINISIEKRKKNITLVYKDNCGGVDINPIEKIFDYSYSTKKDGHGIGLAILKLFVEDKLGGKIEVSNYKDGLLFRIVF